MRFFVLSALAALLVSFVGLGFPGQGDKTRKPTASPKGRGAKAGPGGVAGDLARGKQLYKSKCAICHFDTSTAERVGPGLQGLFKIEKMPKSGLAPTEDNVRRLILEGSGTMQPFRGVLTRQQLADLMAYLKTL